MKIMTSREFNQHIGQAQRAAQSAPVFVTNRGKPAFVFLNYEEYQRLTGGRSALEALTAAPDLAAELVDIEFELSPHSRVQRPPVDFGE